MALVNESDVLKYIPQRKPIVMVSELVQHSELLSTSRFQVSPDNMFCQNGCFTEPGLIENIAQTAALRSGYEASINSTGDEDAPVGFIGAVSRLKIDALPADNSLLETTVEVLNQIFGVTLVKGTTMVNGKQVAECEMKIVLANG